MLLFENFYGLVDFVGAFSGLVILLRLHVVLKDPLELGFVERLIHEIRVVSSLSRFNLSPQLLQTSLLVREPD